MSVILQESYAPLSPKRIEETESKLTIEFPPDYRAFLLTYNGGRPVPDTFRMNGRFEMVDRFLGIHEGEHDNLLDYMKVYESRLPPELLPIAHDAFGNLLCLVMRGPERGRVYFWDHEWEPSQGEPQGHAGLTCVAESFAAFLESLMALPEDTKNLE